MLWVKVTGQADYKETSRYNNTALCIWYDMLCTVSILLTYQRHFHGLASRSLRLWNVVANSIWKIMFLILKGKTDFLLCCKLKKSLCVVCIVRQPWLRPEPTWPPPLWTSSRPSLRWWHRSHWWRQSDQRWDTLSRWGYLFLKSYEHDNSIVIVVVVVVVVFLLCVYWLLAKQH